jgi:hypothetical protein
MPPARVAHLRSLLSSWVHACLGSAAVREMDSTPRSWGHSTRYIPKAARSKRSVEAQSAIAAVYPMKMKSHESLGHLNEYTVAPIASAPPDTRELAKRERVHDSYIRRLIPFAFLAPRIIETICSGHQPVERTAERLTRHRGLPLLWSEQEHALVSVLAGLTLRRRGDRD